MSVDTMGLMLMTVMKKLELYAIVSCLFVAMYKTQSIICGVVHQLLRLRICSFRQGMW